MFTTRAPRPASRRARGGGAPPRRALAPVAAGLVIGLVAAGVGGGAALALPSDRAEAEGLLLSGDLDGIAELAGAYTSFPPAEERSAPLDASLLGAVDLTVAAQLLSLSEVLTLGAVGQYSSSDVDGAYAASGAVGADGAVAVGGSGATTLTLAPVLDALDLEGVVSDLSLDLGAVAATATAERTAGGASTSGTYRLTGGSLALTAPVLGDVVTALQADLDDASAEINGLAAEGGPIDTTVDGLLGGIDEILEDLLGLVDLDDPTVTATVAVDLGAALDEATGTAFVSGPVTVDLSDGTVLVDLDELSDGALDGGLAPNTELLSDAAVNTVIAGALSDILTAQLPDRIDAAIPALLNAAELDIDVAAGIEALGLPLGELAISVDASVGGLLALPGAAAPTVSLAGTDILGLEVGDLLAPVTEYIVGAVLPAVGGVVDDAFDLEALETTLTETLTETVTGTLASVLDVISTVVSVTVNVQEAGDFRDPLGTDAGAFTQRAATVTLVPGLGGGIELNLASATVRATALAVPVAATIDPPRGPVGVNTEVDITGTGFTGTTAVTFGGVDAADFTVQSDTLITATTPAQEEPGVVAVGITNPDGTDATLEFEFFNVASVEEITPDSGSTLGGDPITITGECFTGATGVTFGGVPGTDFLVVSDTEITVTTPAGAAGAVPVVIANPTECGDLTVEDGFVYVVPGAPALTELDPVRGPETGGTEVTIEGDDFTGTTSVTFGGVEGTDLEVVDDETIRVTTPPGTPGDVDVVVTNGAGASAPLEFEYFDVTDIDAVEPNEGPDDGGNTVTITGDCFEGATDVLFGTTPSPEFTVVSDTVITAEVPAGVGVVTVTVVGAGDCGPGTIDEGYEYFAAPVVDGLEPDEGPEDGGTEVTIVGEGFLGTTGVLFGANPGTALVVESDTEITVTAPAGTPGAVTVTLQHPGGDTDAGDFLYLNVPTVTEVEPRTGPEDGGTEVTIEGEGFLGSTGVTFGGIDGTDFEVVDDGTIVVTTPANVPSTVAIVVENPVRDAAAGDFTYVAGTEVTDVEPGSGPEDGGNEVTIIGVCFTDAEGVLFDGVPALSFTVVNDTTITAVVPAGAGTVDVTVVGSPACGTDTIPGGYEYIPEPVITDLAPTEGPESGGTLVTIDGDGFTGTTAVLFGTDPGTIVTISDTQITVTTPPGAPGEVTVTVAHPGGDVDAGEFAYLNEPTVTEVDPRTGPDDGGTRVTIEGEGFDEATGVTFGGADGTDFVVVDDTTIEVTTPAHPVGTVDIVVLHPVTDAAGGTFEYVAGTEVGTVVPDLGPEDGGNTVTITGVCFTNAEDVLFDGASAISFEVLDDTTITAVVPAGTGTVDVTVVGSDICGTDTVTDGYEYVAAPEIDGLEPTEGPETGGTVVTITGEGLEETTGVLFGTNPGTDLVVTDTEITVTTPAGTPGVVTVTVQHPGGDTDAGDFAYLDVPGITSLTPTEGPEDGGTEVTIIGEGFDGATGVTFGDEEGVEFDVVSDTEITVITPAHAPATVPVVVLHPNGDSPAASFTFIEGAEIDTVTPPGGPEEGGNTVTITGSCFTGATGVLFGTTPASSFTVVSDTEITAVAPAGVGTVDVTVVGAAACGTDTIPDGYEYTDDPVIGAITPASGPETGGTRVTITGSNFDGTEVRFDGLLGTDLVVVSDSELQVTTPAHVPATVEVVVITDAGTSEPGEFTYYPVTTITDSDPTTGPIGGGTVVTIAGHCFTGATGVLFGGVASRDFRVVNDSTIIARTPAAQATGAVTITVVGAGSCGEGELTDGFTYVPRTASTGSLPATGADGTGSGALAALGLMLLVGGGILATAVRIRRRTV